MVCPPVAFFRGANMNDSVLNRHRHNRSLRLLVNNPLFTAVMNYRHSELMLRFGDRFDLPTKECERIFDETKRWLYLVGKHSESNFNPAIWDCMTVIDEMWHEFMLYSEDYSDFCLKYFGRYIHHLPTHSSDKSKTRTRLLNGDLEAIERQRIEIDRLISLVFDLFGRNIARLWFQEFKLQYPTAKLRNLQIKALQRKQREEEEFLEQKQQSLGAR